MIAALSSAPNVTDLGPNVYRFWNDLDASKAMVAYFTKKDTKKLAFIYENTDYAVAYVNAVKSQYKGEVILDEKFNSEEKDLNIIAKNLKDVLDEADMVVVLPQNDTTYSSLLKAFQSEGIMDQVKPKIIGADTMYSDSLVKQFGSDIEGTLVVQFPNTSETGSKAKAFSEEFAKSHTINRPTFLAFNKEAVEVLLSAISEGKTTPAAVREYLDNINTTNQRDGYIGKYYFDKNGSGQGLEFVCNKIKNGKLITL